jgi:hypothetical protein
MMTDNVDIPVDVDTRKAKADLKQLHRAKGRATKRVSSAARRTSRMATRAFAFTGAASVVGKFQNNEPSGKVDILAEALVPYYAKAQNLIDKELGYSARARRSAREQTKAAFAYRVGRTGETSGMRDFYNTVAKIQSDVESGRNLVRQDPRFIGADPMTAGKAALKGNLALFLKNLEASQPFRLLLKGADYVVDGIEAD